MEGPLVIVALCKSQVLTELWDMKDHGKIATPNISWVVQVNNYNFLVTSFSQSTHSFSNKLKMKFVHPWGEQYTVICVIFAVQKMEIRRAYSLLI